MSEWDEKNNDSFRLKRKKWRGTIDVAACKLNRLPSQKKKPERKSLKHYFQSLPTSCRDNVLSLANGYVVYQEEKTKQAQKEARQTPGSTESKPR